MIEETRLTHGKVRKATGHIHGKMRTPTGNVHRKMRKVAGHNMHVLKDHKAEIGFVQASQINAIHVTSS